jgi:hypothetical protein
MRQLTSPCVLLVASLAMAVATAARADEAADTAAARVLGGDGIMLADAGDCQQAVDKLRRAEDLHPAPSTAARLGECEIGIGLLVAGTERLQRLLREGVPSNAPAPFIDALARARRVLDHALPRIATMRISVRVPVTTKVQVTVDGERLPEALLDNDRPADPGRHKLVASAIGFLTKTEEVTLSEGETIKVSLELLSDRTARVAAPPEPLSERNRAATPPKAASSEGIGPGGIVAFSVGGVGLAAGIASGIVVAFDSADLTKSCGSNRICPPSKQSEISSAKTWATISSIGFGVAGAGLTAGIMALLFATHHESPGRAEAQIRPIVGPFYFGCEGVL